MLHARTVYASPNAVDLSFVKEADLCSTLEPPHPPAPLPQGGEGGK
jgi:hypothetical protein